MQYDENAEKYGYEGEMTPMKCDELQSYKGDVTIPVYGTIADAEVYLKKDVDAAIAELKEFAEDACLERDDNQTAIDELQAENTELKAKLAEKDKEIAELKKKLMPCLNGDCILTCEVVEKYGKENAELKQKLDEYVLVKLSTQQMLQNLIDCGLIKEWYFNGKFNVVLKADDPHLQIKELKQKLENVQASMYADVVDANMENRRLKRALYNLRAVYADMMQKRYIECKTDGWVHRVDKWIEVERKCLKKAEEYK